MTQLTGLPSATAYLKPRKAKPFFYRHPWVFSGAIQRIEGEWEDGDLITLKDDKGQFIANGYVNSQSQIMIRLLSWKEDVPIDEAFFRRQLQNARDLRHDILSVTTGTNAYRAFFGESDGIPGLVIDRYANFLSVQIQTLGMHLRREMIIDIVKDMYNPTGIYEKSDTDMLKREGMEIDDRVLFGSEPPDLLRIESDSVLFDVRLQKGQKTGFYLDQRENRKTAAMHSAGRRVLDCFCHTGAFSLYMAKLGRAASVLGIDSSADAIELARHNMQLNDIRTTEFRVGKLPQALNDLRLNGETFDMIVLDPPQYAKSKSVLSRAINGYRQLNIAALNCLEEGGILITSSCSQHLSEEAFEQMLNEAAFETGKSIQVLERRSQSSDHPIIISCPQTRYLKCFICRVF